MSMERDYFEERRRKWRRSAFWRGFLVAAVIAIILVVVSAVDPDARPRGPHIAKIEIYGIIVDDPARDALLAEIRDTDDARALIVRIDSPGGTTVGAEALYLAIREIAETRPVVAVMGEMAASGGYIAAIGADHIVARGNTLTGSIGVILEYPDVTELMDRIGIGIETYRSSELKADASPFRAPTPEGRAAQTRLIEDAYAWFRDLVGERRALQAAALNTVATGGIFSGRQALANGLIDALGGENTAIGWIESTDASLADLPVSIWENPPEAPGWTRFLGQTGAVEGVLGYLTRQRGARLFSIFN